MAKRLDTSEKTRFDAKLTKTQKELFEAAARLGGFRTLTEFVISTVQEKAREIVEQHNVILATETDRVLFFDALMHPPGPNKELVAAARRYEQLSEDLNGAE